MQQHVLRCCVRDLQHTGVWSHALLHTHPCCRPKHDSPISFRLAIRWLYQHALPRSNLTNHAGAGKSTLVNYILSENHGFRIAVIMNEIGDQKGIEKALLQDEGGGRQRVDEWVELTNGCLCCSVKDDFVNALESLMIQQSVFDYILIETTGLANPGPVAAALWTDEELEAGPPPPYSLLTLLPPSHSSLLTARSCCPWATRGCRGSARSCCKSINHVCSARAWACR